MAKFRLPAPFNDPEDDVVFPAGHEGGGGFRTAAPRVAKQTARKRNARGMLFTFVTGLATALVMLLGAFWLVRKTVANDQPIDDTTHAPPSPQPPVTVHTPAPPVQPSPPPSDPAPHRVALDPGSWLTPNPGSLGFPTADAVGSLTFDTNVPAQCTILTASFHTPIENVRARPGAYEVSCVSRDRTAAGVFRVVVRSSIPTVERGLVLAPIGSSATPAATDNADAPVDLSESAWPTELRHVLLPWNDQTPIGVVYAQGIETGPLGSITLNTDYPALCSFRRSPSETTVSDYRTPIRTVPARAGRYRVDCVSTNGMHRAAFYLRVREHQETRELHRALGPAT